MTAPSTTTRQPRRGWLIAALAATLTVLLGSIFAAVAWGGTWGQGSSMGSGFGGSGYGSDAAQAAPDLPGQVVRVSAADMGGPMMGGRTGMGGGMMYLRADRTTVAHGQVSFLVTNDGRRDHELVVLPLADGESAGNRTIGADNQIDETGSLGEASSTNAEGTGEGIAPGTSGWVTLTLPPGHYELACNLPGHYAAGMSTELTVT
ncbi:plastocyanin/azurin family copper-binding protein [Pengzhenrongella phosphoraccumulans]|uniref:plastocyanin/azurin family copper-binding protein n=1 Tax=Pengzhenrongella phosphoraccumulans TaxID=3114394 RepID=UPI003890F283